MSSRHAPLRHAIDAGGTALLSIPRTPLPKLKRSNGRDISAEISRALIAQQGLSRSMRLLSSEHGLGSHKTEAALSLWPSGADAVVCSRVFHGSARLVRRVPRGLSRSRST